MQIGAFLFNIQIGGHFRQLSKYTRIRFGARTQILVEYVFTIAVNIIRRALHQVIAGALHNHIDVVLQATQILQRIFVDARYYIRINHAVHGWLDAD